MKLLDALAILLFVAVIKYWRLRGRGAWLVVPNHIPTERMN